MTAAIWSDGAELLWLGTLQSLPVLLLALVLDRLCARFGLVAARQLVWACVLLDLFVPPTVGAAWHVATVDVTVDLSAAGPIAAPFATATALVWSVGLLATLALASARDRRVRRRLLDGAVELPDAWRTHARRCADRIGLRRLPRIVVARPPGAPCALGVLRPIVVLDRDSVDVAAADADGRERFEHVLLHEFGHVRRRDSLRALLVRAMVAIWWFHPSAWLVARRFALFRELGCDALVASLLRDRRSYARTLVLRAERSAGLTPATAFVRMPAEVVQRVAALGARGRGPGAWLAALAAVAAMGFGTVPVHAVTAVAELPVLSDRELRDLPGCLQRRFYVLSRLAAANPSPDPNPSHEPR